jgi:hypothetical protein
MFKLTLDERQREKIRIIEKKIAERAERKAEKEKKYKEVYEMWCESIGDYKEVARKLNYSVRAVHDIIYKIRKKKKNENQDD